MPRPRKRLKVVEKKLGRERAWGQAYKGEKMIEIDPRMKSKQRLNVLIHEALHIHFPDLSETAVDKAASFLSNTVWEDQYRRIQP
jgi:hypothetical protein